jgi:hypothetical protein
MFLRRTRMDGHAYGQPIAESQLIPGCRGERVLGVDGGEGGADGIWEDGANGIASGLEDPAVVRRNSILQERVVAGERGGHGPGKALPQAGAALDIGKEEHSLAGWFFVAHHRCSVSTEVVPGEVYSEFMKFRAVCHTPA